MVDFFSILAGKMVVYFCPFFCLQEGEPSGKRKADDDDKASKKPKKYVISDEEEEDDD